MAVAIDFRAGGKTVAVFRKQLTKAHAVSVSFDVAGNLLQKGVDACWTGGAFLSPATTFTTQTPAALARILGARRLAEAGSIEIGLTY